MPDVLRPSLLSFEIATPVVDLSSGDATLRFRAGATDDLSGISSIDAEWKSPSGDQSFYLGAYGSDALISGTKNNGTWRSDSRDLNQYSESGTWRLSYLDIYDEAGNEKEYDRADLDELGILSSFEVVGGIEDRLAPSLSSLEITTPVVDLSSGDATLRFRAGATDDLSGISSIDAEWKSPSGDQSFYLGAYGSDALISGTKNNGTWRSDSRDLNQYSELGTWRLSYLDIYDEAGNEKEYDRADLDELGILSSFEVVGTLQDRLAPSLSSLEFTRPVVDLSSGDATLRFRAGATDDFSGISSIDAEWKSPSGDQSFYLGAYGSDALISGTKNNGTWRSDSRDLNQYSELGTWRLSYLDIYDEAGNEKEYDEADLDELGIFSSFEVTSGGRSPGKTPTPEPTPTPVPTPVPGPSPVPSPTPEPTLTGDPPTLITAILRGKDITLQFDNTLSDTLPSAGRFTLNQSNRLYLVADTEIRASEGIVTLTVEKELDPTVALTLDYLDFAGDQTSGVIESSTGVDLESFTGFSLNNQGSQENSLTIDEGEFEGNQITLFLSAPISDAMPSKRRFKVKSANKKQKILDVSTEPDDGIVVLTTKKSLDLQESVFVSYRDLGGDQVKGVLEDVAGNDMGTIQDLQIVSGGNDAIAPKVVSATLDENTLSVEFDSIIRNTSISRNRFKVRVNAKKVRVLSATVEEDDSYVDLALKPKNLRTIDINSSVTLAYNDPKGDQTSKVVEDMYGNDLESFSGYGVEIVKI